MMGLRGFEWATALALIVSNVVTTAAAAVTTTPHSAAPAYARSYEGASPLLRHDTGHAVGSSWAATSPHDVAGFLSAGPDATDCPPRTDILVSFYLSIDSISGGGNGSALAWLEVFDVAAHLTLGNATVRVADFEAAGVPQPFYVLATPLSSASLQYNIYFISVPDGGTLTHHSTNVTSLDDPGSLGAFWNTGEAHFEYSSKHRFPSASGEYAMNVGFFFVADASPDAWYLFHRQYDFEPAPTYCKADYARIVVRNSTDGGLTWSNATVIASPIPNTPGECALVDGAAHFDASTSQWVYLSQCLARDEIWRMCLFTGNGSDPAVIAWAPSPSNPVVAAGALWSRVCAGAGKHCSPTMADEGTPDVVLRDSAGRYVVTFHGWDPSHVKSARGAARTSDFVHWDVTGAGLPGDAMFSSIDCDAWDVPWIGGRCVGGGEGSILLSGDWMYELIEAPDVTLGCVPAPGLQHWPLGLLRAPRGVFLPTGQWQRFAVSPTVVAAEPTVGCYIQYHRLFSDAAGGVHLAYWAGDWLQLFNLVPGAGPLPIVAGPPPS